MADGRGLAPPPPGLGVTLNGDGIDIAIPAPGATELFFCVFEEGREVARHALPSRQGDVFFGHIPGIAPGTAYGLRASGPWAHRFNPQKLLLDPWARALEGPVHAPPCAFDTGEEPDQADSGPHLVRALVQAPLPPQDWRAMPARPEVLYEMHVRGFTRQHPEIPEALRGTFAGLAHPAAIAHLTRLGVTMVELLPTAAWVDERHLGPLGLSNYWGYNSVCWLAPDPRLAPGGMAEVRAAVAALRAAGIGVILDIVLNHSGEGDALGPTLSLRGLGNEAWYRHNPDGSLANDTGCGNTLALDQPWPLRLAMDAMRHWAGQAGVDGFRLDLATTLGRTRTGFTPDAPLLLAMRQDPMLRTRRIIAEPWDIGPGGYQLGRYPAGWAEWNDHFRDDVRRFWHGTRTRSLGPLATRLAGSADVFPDRIGDSVNFITAHDGFTLRDLVSYEHRHNLANGEENRDGTGDNHSWNHGVEGPTDDAAIQARRDGDVRSLMATLLAARGLPMIAMGDEAGRSQSGNNNAYAQDHAGMWLDWAGMDQGLVDFTAKLIAARKAHPALHAPVALTGERQEGTGLPDVTWLHADGHAISPHDWGHARCLVAVLHHGDDRVVLACNGANEAYPLRLPSPRWGYGWALLADSARPDSTTIGGLAPRSVVLLAETPSRARSPDAADPDSIARLAAAAGLAPVWQDLEGREHHVPEATLRQILGALGLPAETAAQARDSLARRRQRPVLPAHIVARAEEPTEILLGDGMPARLQLELTLEDGRTSALVLTPEGGRVALPPLPMGRHMLRWRGALCRITAAPPACYLPPSMEAGQRHFGLTAQSYSLRHAADQGMGDFTAIAELARHAGARGALWLGISPPHALHPTERERASPYQPSDRRFLEPMLIDVARLGGGDFSALRALDSVDYPAVWQAKRAALHAAWARFDRADPAFAAFRAAGGSALDRFAAFNALAERAGHSDARQWPAGLRHGRDAAVAAFCAQEAEAVGFHTWLQFTADRQLAEAAAAGAGLYRDLAVGTAADGAEFWSGDGGFLPGLSIGAPPDPLGPLGQVWGVPPPDPIAAEASGHAAFATLIRANMRHATALRIDHVLGLKRLFLVPEGASAAEGCYLDQPFQASMGEVALESHRAGCVVVGEDLGTVPPGLREALHEARALSYRVLWFERDGQAFSPPDHYPALAAACIATHDLPTLAGWWEGADIAERQALGLLGAADAEDARAERLMEQETLFAALRAAGIEVPDAVEGPMPPELAGAIHAYVAATPSLMLLVQAEDLAGERVAVNLPGTDRERANWRHRIALDAEGIFATPVARAVLAGLGEREAKE
ncbi:glycogen debranching protein GlgX [Roseococcus sp.]|uniref:glycogen debranching protein GlgX n=1 Tax=Roseococcus sp. TaxID=2109646 RepID=UPI003BAC39AA